jgi:hypothetical protein
VQGARGVEEDLVVPDRRGGVEIGGPLRHAVRFGEGAQLVRVAAGEHRLGHDELPSAGDAALLADGQDGAHEVLVGAHASGDAVEDDADFSCEEEFGRFRDTAVGQQ